MALVKRRSYTWIFIKSGNNWCQERGTSWGRVKDKSHLEILEGVQQGLSRKKVDVFDIVVGLIALALGLCAE